MSLTPDHGRRAVRAVAAATAKLAAGAPGKAGKLMQIARQGPLGPADAAHLELLEARALLLTKSQAAAPERLLRAAREPEWGLGIIARCRALTASDTGQAEDLYTEAVSRLGRTSIATDLARAHLVYGEWLRRQRRRADAREQLRTAYGMFAAMGAEGFAGRTARELRATGEHPRKRSAATTSQLTPQQAQITQLAGAGLSTPEIAAQLFVSPRTIEYHLQNIYTKLGITSRAQLPRARH